MTDTSRKSHLSFREACEQIVKSQRANGYAKAYAMVGMALEDPHEIYVQSLYVLNNITHWREPQAKAVRAALKEIKDV